MLLRGVARTNLAFLCTFVLELIHSKNDPIIILGFFRPEFFQFFQQSWNDSRYQWHPFNDPWSLCWNGCTLYLSSRWCSIEIRVRVSLWFSIHTKSTVLPNIFIKLFLQWRKARQHGKWNKATIPWKKIFALINHMYHYKATSNTCLLILSRQ